ncbi:MAG: hypothetical protein KGO23_10575 [Nitrospirota bacterium]|nr:hypothetical protein [Nitrospirota bacterium]
MLGISIRWLRGARYRDLFKADLGFDREDVELLRKGIVHCAKVGDFTIRHKLEEMVVDSEEHVDWLETQFLTIEQDGLDRYLAEHIRK